MPFEYLEEIATADVAFKAWGETCEAMFVAAGEATMNVMVADLETIVPRESRQIAVSSDATDMLLFNFLQELIFYKDAEQLLLRVSEVHIARGGEELTLTAEATGEVLDMHRHDLIVDVKAVTLHLFAVEQTARGWEAMVILDI